MHFYNKIFILYLILLVGLYIINTQGLVEKFRSYRFKYHFYLIKPRYFSKKNIENKDYYYISKNPNDLPKDKRTIVHQISCVYGSSRNNAMNEVKTKFNKEYYLDKKYNLYKIPTHGYRNRRKLRNLFTTSSNKCKVIK